MESPRKSGELVVPPLQETSSSYGTKRDLTTTSAAWSEKRNWLSHRQDWGFIDHKCGFRHPTTGIFHHKQLGQSLWSMGSILCLDGLTYHFCTARSRKLPNHWVSNFVMGNIASNPFQERALPSLSSQQARSRTREWSGHTISNYRILDGFNLAFDPSQRWQTAGSNRFVVAAVKNDQAWQAWYRIHQTLLKSVEID